MIEALVDNRWILAARGGCGLVFGAVAIAWPGMTISLLADLFAAYMLIDGSLAIASAARSANRRHRWTALAAEGIVDIVAGLAALVLPVETVSGVITVAGIWAVLSGAALMMAGAAYGLRAWLLMVAALVSLLLGCLLFFLPFVGLEGVAVWLGVYALCFGGALLALGWNLRLGGRQALSSGPAVPD